MAGDSPWVRQRREIGSYNTFYSAITGRASDDSFHERGYILVNIFPVIKDPRNEVEAQPDFLLYDGHSLLLVEVKSGNNIEERHISQITEFSKLSIERAENYLKETEPIRKSTYDGSVANIEPVIAYQGLDQEYIQNCRNDWPDCQKKLEALEEAGPVLIQSRGGRLELVAGSFTSEEIQDWLNKGIELPANPKKEILLTEGMEAEALAVAICGIWGQQAAKEDVQVSITDIRSHFDNRPIEPGRVRKVVHFLNEVNACEIVEKGTMKARFTQEHMDQILNIERKVAEKSVDAWLE